MVEMLGKYLVKIPLLQHLTISELTNRMTSALTDVMYGVTLYVLQLYLNLHLRYT